MTSPAPSAPRGRAKSYQFFAPLPAPWYERLKASIAAVGVLVPIVVDEEGAVLDGHHRRRACAELHIDCPSTVMEGLSEAEKEAYVITTNALRRQLSGTEKAQAVNRLKSLGWSTRRISAELGLHHSTVAGARNRAPDPPVKSGGAPPETARVPEGTQPPPVEPAEEGTGDRPPPPAPTPRVTGRDGKSYPARKPPRARQFERTDADDFKDRFWKEMEHTYKTLLTMNPARVVECAPLLDHKSLVDFARSLGEYAVELQTAASTKPNLKAVNDAT